MTMEIILCDKCNGEGTIEQSKFPERERETIECPKCKGDGRMLTKTYTIEVPFNYNKLKLNKVDHEIFKLMRSL